MINTNDFQKAVELIKKSKHILLMTHTKPDGDACGSIAAMCEALVVLGKNVELALLSELPGWYEFLFDKKAPVFGRDITAKQLAGIDLVILIDVNSFSQLSEIEDFLKQNKKPVLVFDHHVTGDGLGDVELVDTAAAATGLVIFDFLKYAKWQITGKIAQALFVAIASDTGWFQFSNTDSRVYRCCAELIDAGINPMQIHHDLYHNFSPSRLKLMVTMLGTLQLHFNGRYATQYLLRKDFEQTGAKYTDTENLIDECRRIDTVEVAALFVELEDGRIKCSLRSKDTIDVGKIAQKFGGGGHAMAAGANLPGTLEKAMELIGAQIEKQLR